MKAKSLPEMFVMASVMSDEEAEAKLELPTRVDPILPSVMRAQLEAAIAAAKAAKAAKTAKASAKPSAPPPPVVAELSAVSAAKETAAARRRSALAWIPGVLIIGAALGIGAGVMRGDGRASVAVAAAAQPAPPPAQLVTDPIPATPPAPETTAPSPTSNEITVPVSTLVVLRAPIVIPRSSSQGAPPARVEPPRSAALTAVPQQPAPVAKPAPATPESPTKAKGDADFEAAMRAAQRANQQIDQSLR